MKFICLFLVLAVYQTNADFDYFNRARCTTQGGTLKNLGVDPPDASLTVLLDMPIECDGKISQWEIFAREPGNICLSVWRIKRDEHTMKLVGKTCVTIIQAGYQLMELGMKDRIDVVARDVIGFHYLSAEANAVISMDTTGNAVRYEGIFDDSLKQGIKMSAEPNHVGKASIQALVTGVTDKVHLVDGPTPREGRVELMIGEVWGTVCDKWFVDKGWPMVLCRELGYPDVVSSTTTTQAGQAIVEDPEYPIHLHSPRGKASKNNTMLNLDEVNRKAGECTHDLDVYVKCAARAMMMPAPEKVGWGIPKYFEYGEWGDICDTRDPAWHLENKQISWVRAFCVEAGYSGLEDLERVENPLTFNRSLREDPICNIENPTRMVECPSGPLETECDGQLYYVKCSL